VRRRATRTPARLPDEQRCRHQPGSDDHRPVRMGGRLRAGTGGSGRRRRGDCRDRRGCWW
jgi:hypothetical protein